MKRCPTCRRLRMLRDFHPDRALHGIVCLYCALQGVTLDDRN